MSTECPFCDLASRTVLTENGTMIAIPDGFAISSGHTLLVPRRHVASFFELEWAERWDLVALLDEVKALLDAKHAPDAYNVGFNEGEAAGRTVPHFHLHVIPRFAGDVEDPRGGIRWVLAEKAKYWEDEGEDRDEDADEPA